MAGKESGKDKSKRNLIIFGVVVLVVIIIFLLIFILGQFNPGAEPNNSCRAYPSYFCNNAFLKSTTSNLELQLGQNTGKNWTNIYFVFVPEGTQANTSGVPEISFIQPNATYLSNMGVGAIVTLNLTVAKQGTLEKGQQVIGSIWAKYMLNDTNQYAEIATINIKVS